MTKTDGAAKNGGWGLEVVRGRDVGHRYALSGMATVLGNALGGMPGIDLSGQEGTSPRRMAPRQAQIEANNGSLAIRDLDSPGGTFVNRQRILPGQARPLADGDVIQLGGVQLRVVGSASAATVARPQAIPTTPPPSSPPKSTPPPLPPSSPKPGGSFSFVLKSGATCRNWDDFLVVAAQRWAELRDELTSGRLAAFLASAGYPGLAPRAGAGGSPDELLDDWLGTLPVTREARPELDVHPPKLVVKATGGGTTRRSVRLSNVGHRLLRSTVRVEPAGIGWLRIAPEHAGRTILTVEGTDVPLEIDLPERLDASTTATVVVEGNGGSKRVEVVLEPPQKAPGFEAGPAEPAVSSADWVESLARVATPTRLAWGVGIALALRLLIALAVLVVPIGAGARGLAPDLARPAVLFALLGALGGLAFALRRGGAGDLAASGFAGGVAGLMLAALAGAIGQSFEGGLPGPGFLAFLLALSIWAALGAGAAGLSALFIPHRPKSGGS